jgi:hypothetical protein
VSLTFATGATQNVQRAATTLGDARTYLWWMLPTTQGEGDAGVIYRHDEGGSRQTIQWNAAAGSKKLQFRSNRATDGIWTMTTGLTTLTEWHGCVLTYDGALTTNDPILYVLDSTGFSTLAVGSGLTEDTTPSGAEGADGGSLIVGDSGAGTAGYDGSLGEMATWASLLLSAAEAAAVLVQGALAVPGAYFYWPMDNTGTAHATDLSGNARTGTITGAVVGANPPVRPAGRKG